MQETFGPYPGDEFICVLDGRFTMIDVHGDTMPVSKGNAVALRNGVPMSWKQEGYLKKFFLVFLDPRAPKKIINNEEEAVVILDNHTRLVEGSDASQTQEHTHIAFRNDAKNMTVGLWESTEADYGMLISKVHKLVHVKEGDLTILEPDGKQHQIAANSCFFIPKGTECQWKIKKYLKIYYAAVDI